MAFKKNTFAASAATNPAAHFKTLTKRQYPDVMPHQKDILEEYADKYDKSSDVALQLPTGSGKTLVGLLIADWRRTSRGDRAVYLCPTRQLVRQTVLQAKNQYGIDVVDLSGRKSQFTPSDRAAYKTGAQIAITTYSGLFNTRPFFEDPNLIIVDDAHAAENYIANMWSLTVATDTPLYGAIVEFLRPHIDPQEYSRLTGDWTGPADSTWVEKIPSPLLDRLAGDLVPVIDAHATHDKSDLHYPWSLLRSHIDACHVYLSPREILVRPLVPPTFTHPPFFTADQRIFMSATLGAGGDLERLTGRKNIDRLPAPVGFQSAGVGRRFFIFPSLSLNDEKTDRLRLEMTKRAGRSVTLTPSTPMAESHTELVKDNLTGFQVFTKDDIENDKAPFVSSPKAVAILANRYDGIDFPGDECRLLCVDGLPKAMNSQERFLMSSMGAGAIYNERVQTRVLQAMGRCTRALQDRSAVFITGTELVDFLADDRKWSYFPSELQAELTFGVDQSKEITVSDILDNFDMFIENNADWSAADGTIRSAITQFNQLAFPAMDELEAVVNEEIAYQEAMWHRDYSGALAIARTIIGRINHSNLRGYRALWHYLAGSSARRLSTKPGDTHAQAAQDHFRKAKSAAPSVSWLNTLAREVGEFAAEGDIAVSAETLEQIEALERQFIALGITTNNKFEKRAERVLSGLEDTSTFEQSQVELGTLLGFSAGNDESDAAPDPWWLGKHVGIVFETNADAKKSTIFGATKARQASSHPKWIKKNVPGAQDMDIVPVLLTPCTKAKSGADPHLEDVRYWALADFRAWAQHAITVLRDLKGKLPGDGDLIWRAEAGQILENEGLTLETISCRPRATELMEIVK